MSYQFHAKIQNAIQQDAKFRATGFEKYPDALERTIEFGTFYLGLAHPNGVAKSLNQRLITDVRDWVCEFVDSDRINAAFVDATTLYTVKELIQDDYVAYPEMLLDLSSFVNAVVLFDRVFHLENSAIGEIAEDLNETIGDRVFIRIPVAQRGEPDWSDTSSVGALLTGAWKEVSEFFSAMRGRSAPQPHYAAKIRAAWEILLKIKMRDKEKLFAYADYKWETPAPDLLRQALEVLSPEPRTFGYQYRRESLKNAYALANECNQRSLFNLKVSQILDLPYLPGWPRMPFRYSYFQRCIAAQRFLSVAHFLDEEYRKRAQEFTQARFNLQLPFFLSAVLAQTMSKEEFLKALGEVRRKAESFRKHRAELDHATSRGDTETMTKLRRALVKESKHLTNIYAKIPEAGLVGISVHWAATQLGLGRDGLALPALLFAASTGVAHFLASDLIERVKHRLMKPQYMSLVELAGAANAMTNAIPQIGKLWKLPDASKVDMAERFERLRSLVYA